MCKILEQLHQDHKNFLVLLRFVEEQLRLIDEYSKVDLELLLDAVRYMKEYPDCVHHPLEDIVFAYYLKHFSDDSCEIECLLQEHASLPMLTTKAIDMIEAVLLDVPQERQALVNCLQEYIAVQYRHMNHEESTVYPALREKMREQDWAQISDDLASVEDPLFGKQVADSFQKLCYSLPN